VKSAAAGRWRELLSSLGGIDPSLLDGKHHACPKCGGTDRFRYIDDAAGACLCNQCHNTANGDGIASLMWATGQPFPAVLALLGDRLGVQPSSNGNGSGSGTAGHKTTSRKESAGLAFEQLVETGDVDKAAGEWSAAKPGTLPEVVRRCRPKAAAWPCKAPPQHRHAVLAFPAFRPGDWTRPAAVLLYRRDGRPFPASAKLGERKTHLLRGSDDSLAVVGTPEEFEGARSAWLCEGLPDAIALAPFLPPGHIACTNTHGAGNFDDALLPMFAGKATYVVMDADDAGEKGGGLRAGKLYGVAESVRVVKLPIQVMGDRDANLKDCRDLVAAGRAWEIIDAADATKPLEAPPMVDGQGKEAERPAFAKLIAFDDFLEMSFPDDEIIPGVLVGGQPGVIGARLKCMKSHMVCELAVSIASRTKFCGHWDVAKECRVGLWSGESGRKKVQRILKAQKETHDIDRPVPLFVNFSLPKLSLAEHLEVLHQVIEESKLDVCIFDPLYMALLTEKTAGLAGNVYAMGVVLEPLTRLGQATNCTILTCHHFKKNAAVDQEEPCSLEELSQAGVAEWVGQWILLARRSAYKSDGQHELFMRVGGRAGHASFWALDVDEGHPANGPDGQKWEVAIRPVADAREEAKAAAETRRIEQREKRDADDCRKMLEAVRRCPNGETQKELSKLSGISNERGATAIRTLLGEGRISKVEIKKNRRTEAGYVATV